MASPDAVQRGAGVIAEMEAGIGAGGPYHRQGLEADFWRLPSEVLDALRCKSESCGIFRVMSPLMEPAIPRGAHVLVDFGCDTVHDGQIYAVDNGVSLVLKRIFVHGATADLVSDAAPDRSVTVALKQVKIAGRVVAQLVRPL